MNDITGKELQKGDLFIGIIQNRMSFGIAKSAKLHGTLHFYKLDTHGLSKLKYDSGLRELVPVGHWGRASGRSIGQGYIIDFMQQEPDRVLLIEEKQIPENLQEIYKEMRKYI
jgi:hypothetical protein